MQEKIILWGLGDCYHRFNGELRNRAAADEKTIVGVVASRREAENFDGIPWLDKKTLTSNMADYIVVMSEQYFHEILEEAKDIGFKSSQILSITLLRMSDYAWNEVSEIGSAIAAYTVAQKTEDIGGLLMLYNSYGYSWEEYRKEILGLRNYHEHNIQLGGGICS